MRFRRMLKWTLAAHLLAVAVAYFARPTPTPLSHKPMQAVTITLKPKPAPPIKTSKAPATKVEPTKRKTAAKKAKAPSKKRAVSKKPTSKPEPKVPAPLAPLPIDYQQLLALKLKEQLELPEMGLVELKITFSPEGTIAKIETRLSESEKNARYLTEALKKIELPPLPRNMRGKTEPLIIEFSSKDLKY